MISSIRKIGVAITFSPRLEALFAESIRLSGLLGSALVLIHVGKATQSDKNRLADLIQNSPIPGHGRIQVVWESGRPASTVVAVCKREQVDLLIAGVLRKESLMRYHLGSVARKIIRKAECSVMLLVEPSLTPGPFRNIVVSAKDSHFVEETIVAGCHLGIKDHSSWIHIVRDVKMYGLAINTSGQHSGNEYGSLKQNLVRHEIDNVEKILQGIPHEGLRINIKLVSRQSGFELSKFADLKHADLLVVGDPPNRFALFQKFFSHDLDAIFADLPCNLLIIKQGRGGVHG